MYIYIYRHRYILCNVLCTKCVRIYNLYIYIYIYKNKKERERKREVPKHDSRP